MSEQKDKYLQSALSSIKKEFGEDAIMSLGDAKAMDVETVTTSSIALDIALGAGGIPKGRIIEIYGPESSGKTTLALHAIAAAQKEGGNCVFIDVEHALDPVYAKNLGVDTARLHVSQPDYGEQALMIVDKLIASSAVDLVVVDSVAALTPKAELEGDMEDLQVGAQARLMSKALRKITSTASRSHCTIIFINQTRAKIGGMGYGPQETTAGGNALKFYASVRMEIKRIQTLKSGDEAYGNRVKVKVVKNKVAPPFKTAEFDIYYGEGICEAAELLDIGVKHDIVEKAGTWYSFGGERLGQGKEKARQFLKENDTIRADISKLVREKLGIGKSEEETADTKDNRKSDKKAS